MLFPPPPGAGGADVFIAPTGRDSSRSHLDRYGHNIHGIRIPVVITVAKRIGPAEAGRRSVGERTVRVKGQLTVCRTVHQLRRQLNAGLAVVDVQIIGQYPCAADGQGHTRRGGVRIGDSEWFSQVSLEIGSYTEG